VFIDRFDKKENVSALVIAVITISHKNGKAFILYKVVNSSFLLILILIKNKWVE